MAAVLPSSQRPHRFAPRPGHGRRLEETEGFEAQPVHEPPRTCRPTTICSWSIPKRRTVEKGSASVEGFDRGVICLKHKSCSGHDFRPEKRWWRTQWWPGDPFVAQSVEGAPTRGFWRKLRFPNLVLARKARWKGHVRKGKRADELDLDTPLRLHKRPRGF